MGERGQSRTIRNPPKAGRNRRLAAHSGKIVEEFVQVLPTLKVIQQRLKRYACGPEHCNTAQDVPIFHYDLVRHGLSLWRAKPKIQQTAVTCDFQLK